MTRAPEQELTRSPPPATSPMTDRGLEFSGRSVLTLCGFLAAMILGLYLLLPQLAGLEDTWSRIEDGSPAWIALAFVFTIGMFWGYVELFRGVFARASEGIVGRRESYLITMAGLAASRIFAAGGAGGLVLQAWALRQAGLARRVVADKTISFLILTYFPYAAAVIVCGFGLRLGIFPGEAPITMTLIPAVIAADHDGRLRPRSCSSRPTCSAGWTGSRAHRDGSAGSLQKLASVPAATSAGLRDALAPPAQHAIPRCSARSCFWAFQIAVLYAAFHAFGDAPPLAVLIQAFFVGMLGNLLPIPGGVGGVEGGMIGAFAAFGVDAGLAVVAVLVFRAMTFWLPLLPGVIAFFKLRAQSGGMA